MKNEEVGEIIETVLDMNTENISNIILETLSKEKIIREIENIIRDSIPSLLGLTHSFGRWEIDRCNGRKSILTDMINNKAQEIAQKEINKIKDIKLNTEQIKAIEKDYTDNLIEKIERNLREESYKEADRIVQKLVERKATEIISKINESLFKKEMVKASVKRRIK